MKAKPRQKATSKRQKEGRRNTVLNFLGMLGLAIPLTWATIGIYNYEREEVELKETYETLLPDSKQLIEPNMVCMSTDAYMGGQPQGIVPDISGPYYACSDHCITALQSNEAERYAVDSVNNNRINKAKAFICLHPGKSGRVCYFESKENHLNFLKAYAK